MRPDFCWIGLFALNVWHLAERMFFAGYAKEKHAERNSDDALAKEESHNALPQLSVSGVARKDESVGMPSPPVIRALSVHRSARHPVNARLS
ncbi:MAG TPA: hypothetical protein VJ420_08605 [Candidatus Udaeobacter sp.]|nr:hypothetical protein [Candidatus Udaeobacter sp.]